jgi:hypothetical protein
MKSLEKTSFNRAVERYAQYVGAPTTLSWSDT